MIKVGESSFAREYTRLLMPMTELMESRTWPYVVRFIEKQIEIDSMALKLSGTDTKNNDKLGKLKNAFLKAYNFIYDWLLPSMDYGDIKPLVPIADPNFSPLSSMDSYSKKL